MPDVRHMVTLRGFTPRRGTMGVARQAALSCIAVSAIVSCSLVGAPPTPSAMPVPSLQPPPASSAPSPGPASRDPTPHMSQEIQAILDEEMDHLDLAPVPTDHVSLIDRVTAIATVQDHMNAPLPAVHVDHGIGYINETLSAPVWLVMIKLDSAEPMPVGPRCPPDATDCLQTWAVVDYVVALVSDQTGQVLRSLSTLREVPAPSP